MNIDKLAERLVDQDRTDFDPVVGQFYDRLLLRIFGSPNLMSALHDTTARRDSGSYVIELDFRKLPNEVVPTVKQLIGDGKIDVVEFTDTHGPHTAFKVTFDQQAVEKAKSRKRR